MDSCHLCSVIPRKQQIISCDNCTNAYCLKCIRLQLIEVPKQKQAQKQLNQQQQLSIQKIQQQKTTKSWVCFACQKKCLCRQCKGVGISSIEKQLLGKKDDAPTLRNIEDYKVHFNKLEIFKQMDFQHLSPFQKEYFMNKVTLYCREQKNVKQSINNTEIKIPVYKPQVKKDVIMIDSDDNGEGQLGQQPIYVEDVRMEQIENQMLEANPVNQLQEENKLSQERIELQEDHQNGKIQEQGNINLQVSSQSPKAQECPLQHQENLNNQ